MGMTRNSHKVTLLTGLAGFVVGGLAMLAVVRAGWLAVEPAGPSPTVDADPLTQGRNEAAISSLTLSGFAGESGSRTNAPQSPDAPLTAEGLLQGDLGTRFPGMLRQLRELGMPEDLLVDLVSAEFGRRWDEQAAEIKKAYARGDIDYTERQLWYAQRMEAQEAAIRRLMGDKAFEQWDRQRVLRSLESDLAGLNPQEEDELYQIKKASDLAQHDMWVAHLRGELDPTDYRNQRNEEKNAYQDQLQSLLGADWYASYKYETDGSLASLRRDMRSFNFSSDQIEMLYAVNNTLGETKRDLNAQLASGQIDAAEQARRLALARQERDQAINGILGSQGVLIYEMARNREYKTMRRFASAWELSEEDCQYVFQTLAEHRQSLRSAQSASQASSPEEQQRLKAQTEATLRSFLGNERYERLKREGILNL
jgi:hypothetical protein